MNEHAICRFELAEVMKLVRVRFSPEEIKKAWAWSDGRNCEFHGPNGEYFHNLRADCLWSARAEGWDKVLNAREETGR